MALEQALALAQASLGDCETAQRSLTLEMWLPGTVAEAAKRCEPAKGKGHTRQRRPAKAPSAAEAAGTATEQFYSPIKSRLLEFIVRRTAQRTLAKAQKKKPPALQKEVNITEHDLSVTHCWNELKPHTQTRSNAEIELSVMLM